MLDSVSRNLLFLYFLYWNWYPNVMYNYKTIVSLYNKFLLFQSKINSNKNGIKMKVSIRQFNTWKNSMTLRTHCVRYTIAIDEKWVDLFARIFLANILFRRNLSLLCCCVTYYFQGCTTAIEDMRRMYGRSIKEIFATQTSNNDDDVDVIKEDTR